jgi:hypothetical protein
MLQVGGCCPSLSSSFSYLSGSGGPKIFFFPSFCFLGGGFFFSPASAAAAAA